MATVISVQVGDTGDEFAVIVRPSEPIQCILVRFGAFHHVLENRFTENSGCVFVPVRVK